jgi:peroxiredoxin
MDKSKVLFGAFLVLLVFVGCQKSNKFVVTGKITHAEGRTIYLDELLISEARTIDSARIDKKGEFELEGKTSIPTFYTLRLSPRQIITLLLDSADHVVVQADEVNFANRYHVEGSIGSEQVNELNYRLYTTKKQLDSLNSLNVVNQGRIDYPQIKANLDIEYRKIVQEQIDFSTQFVNKNPFSMASVLALYQQFDDGNRVINDMQTLKTAASALNSIYPQSEHVKLLYAYTLELVKNEKALKMKQFIQDYGSNSPEVVLPNQYGREVALSSFRGKTVLLHFWSVSDPGSRLVNKTLVELYGEFKNKDFEIYQVCIDEDKDAWLKAIEEDGLTWTNVNDMKGSLQAVNNYNVKQLPYNYLLGKDGEILGKGLVGPGLSSFVAEHIK